MLSNFRNDFLLSGLLIKEIIRAYFHFVFNADRSTMISFLQSNFVHTSYQVCSSHSNFNEHSNIGTVR